MTCHHRMTRPSSSNTTATDIVTYRYDGEMVYVPVTSNYVQALTHARDAFPQLRGLRDASLSLSLTAPGHTQKRVGISASAWPKLIAHMSRYQVIDVQVAPHPDSERQIPMPMLIPDITITYADDVPTNVEETDPVPPYRGRDTVDDEKVSLTHPNSRSPSRSPSTLHPKRSGWFFQKLHGQWST